MIKNDRRGDEMMIICFFLFSFHQGLENRLLHPIIFSKQITRLSQDKPRQVKQRHLEAAMMVMMIT